MGAAHLKAPEVKFKKIPGCTSKSAFVSRADAVRSMQHAVKYTKLYGNKLGFKPPYLCPQCNLWHITTHGKTKLPRKPE